MGVSRGNHLLLIGVTEFTLIFSTPKLLPGKQGISKEIKAIKANDTLFLSR